MGIIKRQSILNTIITCIGITFGFVSTLYLFPNILTQEQYGLTRLLLSVSFVLTQFAHLGMRSVVIKFFPFFENQKTHHNGFLFLAISIPLIGLLITVLGLFLFKPQIIEFYPDSKDLFGQYYLFLIPLVISIVYFDVLNSYTRARYRSIPGSVMNEVILRLLAIILLLAFFYGFINFEEFMIFFTASYVIQPIFLLFYLWKIDELYLKPNFDFLDWNKIKEISSYGLFAILGGMTVIIVNNIDIIMLGSLKGLADTAVYSIAFYVSSVIAIPQKSIGKIAPNIISKNMKSGNFKEIQSIYKSSSLNQLIAGLLLFIGIWANMHNLIEILPPKYAEVEYVIVIVGISKLIDMAAGVNGNIILNSEYYRFDLIATIFLVIFSIALNYILIPDFGIIGAAIATAISLLLYNLMKCIFVWVKFRMQPFTSKIIIVVILSIIIYFVVEIIPYMHSTYVDIFVRSVIITTLFSGSIIYLKVSEEVDKLWDQIKLRLQNFIF